MLTQQPHNICILVGEASGDAQAAILLDALSGMLPQTKFWGVGGTLMQEKGMESLMPAEQFSVMGFMEIAPRYLFISKAAKTLLFEIEKRRPSVVILVDNPGLNLRLAEKIFYLGFKIIYYIPPKVWAHGYSRLTKLRKYISLVLSILPFETEFFRTNHLSTVFIGNPLFDAVNDFINRKRLEPKKPFQYDDTYPYIIGLLPGSRKSELESLLPLMIEAFIKLNEKFPNIQARLPIAHTISFDFVQEIFLQTCKKLHIKPEILAKKISIVQNQTYDVMYQADYAWVCSGTATLETAFFKTPMCAIYKLNTMTAILAKIILKVKYVTLVNLCLNKEVIPEYLQLAANVHNMVKHATLMLTNAQARVEMEANFELIRKLFPENAAYHAAQAIVASLSEISAQEVKNL